MRFYSERILYHAKRVQSGSVIAGNSLVGELGSEGFWMEKLKKSDG